MVGRHQRAAIVVVEAEVEDQHEGQQSEGDARKPASPSGSSSAPPHQRNHALSASEGRRLRSQEFTDEAALPASISVAAMAMLHEAIVHSSMQAPPCQPKSSISEIESAEGGQRREPGQEARDQREADDELDSAEDDDRGVEEPEVVQSQATAWSVPKSAPGIADCSLLAIHGRPRRDRASPARR